jgi:hypothetical protein
VLSFQRRAVPRKPEAWARDSGGRGGLVHTVLTRARLGRLLRSRWLFAIVVLAMVLGTVVLSQVRQLALAADTRGATEAVSVGNNNVVGADTSNSPSISANGRFVAFRTNTAFDSVDAGNDPAGGDSDIYVRDTALGTTTLITEDRNGSNNPVPSTGGSQPSISASGRYVAFITRDPFILRPQGEVSIRDTVAICDRGAPNSTTGAFGSTCTFTSLLAGTLGLLGEGSGDASTPTISADGRRLAFLETFDNGSLVGNGLGEVVNLTIDPNTGAMSDPARADFSSPAVPETMGNRTVGNDLEVTLSANGRYLLRTTQYVNSEVTPGTITTVLVNDLNGDPATVASRVDFASSSNTNSFVGDNGNTLGEPAISGNGRRIAFTEFTSGEPAMEVHTVDRDPDGNGAFGPGVVAAVVSGSDGKTPVDARMPAFSSGMRVDSTGAVLPPATPADDGRYLAFVTDAAVHNGLDDSTKNTSCIQPEIIGAFTEPLDSGDGPRMRLAANTGISNCDVVARDLVQDAQRAAAGQPRLPAELASPSQQSTLPGTNPVVTCPTVCEGDNDSTTPVLDADGSAVAYASLADNLLANGADNNKVSDAFKRTFKPVPVVPTLNFGNVTVHTPATGTVTVSYPEGGAGFGPLGITGVAVGGTNGGDFTVLPGGTCTPGKVLHPGDTCVVPIQFKPGDVGTRTGTLTVTTSTKVPGTGTLTGNGVPEPPPRTPVFQAAPDPLAFGAQQPFVPSAPKTVTVTNTGTAPLNITAVALGGANPGDYAIAANTCGTPVNPGGTCTVTVTFAPQATTDRPALLQFTDNAAGSPHVVALTGGGTAPTLVASPPLNRSGAVSQVSGAGWAPNKVVVVTLLTTPIQVTVTASATGTFTVPLVIFPHTPLGKKQLQAQVQAVPQISVTIDFLVVPGSQEPPDFAERR